MNKMRQIFLAIFIASMLAIGVIVASDAGAFAVTESREVVQDGDFISVPTYGYLKCELSESKITSPSSTTYTNFNAMAVQCNQYGTLLQECQVTIRLPTREQIKDNNAVNSYIGYKVCDSTTGCPDTQELVPFIARDDFFFKQPDQIKNINLNSNQYMELYYCEGGLFAGQFNCNIADDKLGRLQVTYRPYEVINYNTFSQVTGEALPNSLDCDLSGQDVLQENFIIEDVRGGGQLSNTLQESELLDTRQIRARGETIQYLSGFVARPPQFSMFDDDTKYCVDKTIYRVEEVETPSGVYKYASTRSNDIVRNVECCNDAEAIATLGAGATCVDFEAVMLSSPEAEECTPFTDPCPIVGYQALAGGQVATQQCINNKCETEYISVACNFDEECNGGVCDVDPLDPTNNKCVNPEPVTDSCGDGRCQASFGETSVTCPKDCDPTPVPSDNTLLFVMLGVAGVSGLGFAVTKNDGGGDLLF